MSATGWTEPTATPSQPENKIVFTSGAKVTINAPAEVVFDVITGFSLYKDWNTWTPGFEFKEPDADVNAGSIGKLRTHMKEQSKEYDVPIKILELSRSPGQYRLAWRSQLLSDWLFIAERIHEVHSEDDNEHSCEVRQWESMSGPLSYIFKYAMGLPDQLQRANLNYLEELKQRSESVYKSRGQQL